MNEKKGLLSSGLDKVMHNKRYILWFWLLNLTLAEFGTSGFRQTAHATLDHSLYAGKLLHGFDAGVFAELLIKPDFGHFTSMSYPAFYFGFIFFLATVLFLPGVFSGYAATYRLPREDFFRACGRNLWRFIRLLIISGIVMGIAAGILFAINGAIVKKAGESTNELLPVELNVVGITIIFLAMTKLRIWFDLAEVDVVLNDQRAVRKSIAAGFRHLFRGWMRLMASYVVSTIVAIIILICGLWIWNKIVPAENWLTAYVIAQITLLLLLIPRFWQRGIAVSYWQQHMLVPVTVQPIMPPPVPIAAIPQPAPVTPNQAVEPVAPISPGSSPEPSSGSA
jgi:uncharacterized membrane protein